MLATQVQYWQYKENQRHNIAYEKLTDFQNREQQRHNLETESQGRQSLTETVRHNKASESLSLKSLNETIRHNKVGEQVSLANLNETIRHNRATEGISYQNIALGYANLAETKRHNIQTENVQQGNLKIAQEKAAYEIQNLQSDSVNKQMQAAKTEQEAQKSYYETSLSKQKSKWYLVEMGAEAFSDIGKGIKGFSSIFKK